MDKAVILARGLGTRMRKADDSVGMSADQAAAADTGVKALIPIDRPFLDYVLGALAEAGYQRICLVIGPEHDAIREYYGRTLKCRRLTFDFAVQDQPLGTADAVRAAQNFAAGDDFLVINSDDYYPPRPWRPSAKSKATAWPPSKDKPCSPIATSLPKESPNSPSSKSIPRVS